MDIKDLKRGLIVRPIKEIYCGVWGDTFYPDEDYVVRSAGVDLDGEVLLDNPQLNEGHGFLRPEYIEPVVV